MDVNSELTDAQLEIRDADNSFSTNRKGLIWFNRATDNVRLIANSTLRTLLSYKDDTDGKAAMRDFLHVVGDFKMAMLTETQFQTDYTSNWVQIEGQGLNAGDYPELAARRPEWVTGSIITLPDPNTFLRINSGRTPGDFQGHGFESHNHGGGAHRHFAVRSTYDDDSLNSGNPIARDYGNSQAGSAYRLKGSNGGDANVGRTSSSGTIINTEGIDETRPDNIAINAFLKVK